MPGKILQAKDSPSPFTTHIICDIHCVNQVTGPEQNLSPWLTNGNHKSCLERKKEIKQMGNCLIMSQGAKDLKDSTSSSLPAVNREITEYPKRIRRLKSSYGFPGPNPVFLMTLRSSRAA